MSNWLTITRRTSLGASHTPVNMPKQPYNDDGAPILSGMPSSSEKVHSELTAAAMGFAQNSPFNYGVRSHHDVGWKWAYLLLSLGVFVGGVACLAQRNVNFFTETSDEYLSNINNCPAGGQRRLQEMDAAPDSKPITAHVVVWLAVTLVVSVCLGLLYIYLFKRAAKAMVTFAAVMHVVVLTATAILFFANGATVAGIVWLLIGLALGVFYWWTRDMLEMCGRLFAIAAHGLSANPSIVTALVCIWLAWTLIMIPVAAFIGGAWTNGKVVRNPAVFGTGVDPLSVTYNGSSCSVYGVETNCCAWQPSGDAIFYMVIAFFFLSWTAFLGFSLRTFIISGTITQWYFTPVGVPVTSGNMMRSVRHALGPQFGTLAAGGFVLAVVDMLRSVLRNEENRRNIFFAIFSCLIQMVLELIEYLTKFALVWSAITGDAFFAGGRAVTTLLKRHLLESVRVWWFPPIVIFMTSLSAGVLWGMIVFLLVLADLGTQQMSAAIGICVFSVLVAVLVLQLCGSILLSVVDAVYICYALDKDKAAVTQPDVHTLFSSMPVHKNSTGVGAVVEQPGGMLAYAPPAPSTHHDAEMGRYPSSRV